MSATPSDPVALRQAIAALEAQRGVLGDAVTDLALAPLRQLLADAESTAGRAAPPQLRRAQVTVLFADIVDSTALASRLDAEDVLQIFGGVLQRAADCVRARGGRVLRYTGDGLKAGFGTQGTREDDAANAVLAGLDILTAAREHAEQVARDHGVQGFALRVGAHTGEVALGAGFEADNTLTGDTVNIAARMEQAAPPGGLRISAETWAHVRGQFDGQPQPPLVVKGVAEPMATWLVQAARSGTGTVERGIAGLAIPMIGRDAERTAIAAAIGAARHGPLQAVTVVADAGIGKTRLLREVLADAAAAADGARVLVVRAHPGAELRPWGLLHGMVSVHCGISDSDSAEQARVQLVAGLAPQLTDDPEAAAQRIGQLLGMDFGDVRALRGLDARALRDLAFADLIRWLTGLCHGATGGAAVLVFEDLHWADEASLDALAHWFVQANELPLALLMSTRPALLERRPAWGSAGPGSRLLQLDALSDAHSGTLADALLQRIDGPPEVLRTLLIERAEGNPFYMEELLRRLLDDGVIRRENASWHVNSERLQGLRLPTTLVGLLQGRLDALPPDERRGVQHASIVGHVFWDDALVQVDPAAAATLDALQHRQWVHRRTASAFDGTAERQFHHHLLHQVTYETVLKEERRRGHAAVAHWLAQRTAGRAPEFLAITGEHAERAGETALAVDCYEQAAREARKRFANAQAVECANKALRLVPADDLPRRHRLMGNLYDMLDIQADRSGQQALLAQREALLNQHPDPFHQCQWLIHQGMLADRLGEQSRSFALTTAAAELADQIGNDDVSAFSHSQLCWLHGQREEIETARAHVQQALQCAARIRETKPLREIQALLVAGIIEMRVDDLVAARSLLEQVYDRAGACDEVRSQLGALHYLSQVAVRRGEHARALEVAERFEALARRIGNPMQSSVALYQQCEVLYAMGRYALAVQRGREALSGLQQVGAQNPQCGCLGWIGHALSALGEAAEARNCFLQIQAIRLQIGPDDPQVLAAQAMVAAQDLDLGDLAQARAGVEQVLSAVAAGAQLDVNDDRIEVHWACQRVLAQACDPRAPAHLQRLQAQVQAMVLQRAGDVQGAAELIAQSALLQRIMDAGAAPPARVEMA
ncbi:MAG: AAA family ATPase [Rubrivivax sp.]|nr:AAA family ATPase [Rubrivivax sp.]